MDVSAVDLFECSAAKTDGVQVKPQVDVTHDRHYRPHVDQHLREASLNKLNFVNYGICLYWKQVYGFGGYPPPPITDGFRKKVFDTFPNHDDHENHLVEGYQLPQFPTEHLIWLHACFVHHPCGPGGDHNGHQNDVGDGDGDGGNDNAVKLQILP